VFICAEPEAPTLSVFPVMLQLVPEVPVCPELEMVRCCEYRFAKSIVKNVKKDAFVINFKIIYKYKVLVTLL
jgi:hypothetical protein